MLIALDFDNTYTADPGCFRAIIRCFQSCNHKVVIVTMRSEDYDYEDEFDVIKKSYGVDTIFCDGQSKREVCEKLGLNISVWIDDWPEGIAMGTQYTPVELTEWRKNKPHLRPKAT